MVHTIPAHIHRVLLQTAVTNELLKRAQAAAQEKAAQIARVAPLAKLAAEALAKHDRIENGQIEKVASACNSHERSLELLAELAKHRTSSELGRSTASEKSAAVRNGQPARRNDAPITNFDETPEGQRFRQSMLS